MDFTPTSIPDVILIQPRIFSDARGFFMETFSSRLMGQAGIPGPFVQDNHSGSHAATLRGLHYQIRHHMPPRCAAYTIKSGKPRGSWSGPFAERSLT